MTLAEHFFTGSDGQLHDTRRADWSQRPLRTVYARAYRSIETTGQLKATLRHGPYVFPGGYELHFVTSDGATLCFNCVRKEIRDVLWSMLNRCDDGWRVRGADINWESPHYYCDHCSNRIPSQYGDDN